MYPGHPWTGETFGRAEFEWYLKRTYELGIVFDVRMGPFLDFCKQHNHRSNQLIMKIAARLSTLHLPQFMLALNGRPRPTRYPAGYVKLMRPDADMLDQVAVREKDGGFNERIVRDGWKALPRWLAIHAPRLAVTLANWFPGEETKDNYTLMVSRNPLRKLNTKVIIMGSHLRTMALAIPYGKDVSCTFYSPHAFGNINFFEPFLLAFKNYMEQPETIPADILDKPYRPAVPKDQAGT